MSENSEFSSDQDEGRIQKQEQQQEIWSIFRTAQEANTSKRLQGFHTAPPVLYHYTTASGLEGILRSNSLWASDVRYMNDASELSHATTLVLDEASNVINEVTDTRLQPILKPLQGHINIFLQSFVNEISCFGPRPFCACFCEDKDLLSQWRGYTAGQRGYSLGLDLGSLQPTLFPYLFPNTILRKVVYEEDKQRSWIREITQTWLTAALNLLDSRTDLAPADIFPYPAVWALQEAVAEQLLCFKHSGFSEENEWRLIKLVYVREELDLAGSRWEQTQRESFINTMKQPGVEVPSFSDRPPGNAEGIDINFRESQLGFIPYIKVNLKSPSSQERLPLQEVVQGPTSDPKLSLDSLRMFLESRHFKWPMIEVNPSEIPLRW